MTAVSAVHAILYSDDPEATRRFLREVLEFPFVSDSGSSDADWLIFGTGPSELGVHPTSSERDGVVYESPLHHQVALMTPDLPAAMEEIAGRGGTFTREPRDDGYGITVEIDVPGAGPVMLYQPRHATAYDA